MTTQEEVARAALAEISPPGAVGDFLDRTATDDGAATLRFASTLPGYPGWHWSVSVAEIPGESPTVMEAELMPGEGALLAPDWVPWAERLEDYRAAQVLIAAEVESDDEDDEDHDDLGDEREEDDDLGDDPDDGIDFEDDDLLGVPLGGIDEEDEAEAESDDDGPEQPDEA